MDIDTSISIRDIFSWLQTPIGRLVLQGLMVFVVSEFVFRGVLKQWLGLMITNVSKAKERAIIDSVAFLCNVLLGVGVGVFIFYNDGARAIIEKSWWIVISSLVFHIAYVRYLDKIIKKKYGIK